MPMEAVPPLMMLSTMAAAAAAAATPATSPTSTVPVTFARDAIIAWFRGEFAAANAIIDSLCSHLTELSQLNDEKVISDSKRSEYDAVFAAIHRRRLNWIPILNMQKYFSIADVSVELNRVIDSKKQKKIISNNNNNNNNCGSDDIEIVKEEDEKQEIAADFLNKQIDESEKETVVEEAVAEEEEELKKVSDDSGNEEISSDDYDSSDRKSSDDDHHEGGNLAAENIQICSNHEDCETRRDNIKMTKGFIAKEPVKGHMVNVVKGLKLYEDIFTDSELSKLRNYINDLRHAGHSGELSGDTFILFNQQLKGNKRELIQLGVPIFGQIRDEKTKSEKSNIEPIPSVLQAVIDHLSQWHLIPESRKPNSCIINFFDEGEYSQPFLKPPHLDQPISTLLLSESTMTFGRVLVSDNNGNYKGPLMLSLKEGSLLVMRGNSADMAKHVICPSENKRVSMTFFKVRTDMNHIQPSTIPPVTTAMTHWQPGMPQPYRVQNGYGPMEVIPKWGLLHAPLIMLAPARPMLMNPRKISNAGTGVFLPWTMKSKKPAKHLPPRAQRARLLGLPSSMETQVVESKSHSAVAV